MATHEITYLRVVEITEHDVKFEATRDVRVLQGEKLVIAGRQFWPSRMFTVSGNMIFSKGCRMSFPVSPCDIVIGAYAFKIYKN